MAQKCIKMSLKLLLFIVFFGVVMQSSAGRTKKILSIAHKAGVNTGEVDNLLRSASDNLGLTGSSIGLNSNTSDMQRYITENLKEVERLFSTGL